MISRRHFLASTAALAVAAPSLVRAQSAAGRVVVIGGGFGGASFARAIKTLSPELSVTLVERNRAFVTGPFSNLVIGGLRSIDSITFGYDQLAASGIEVVFDEVVSGDTAARRLTLAGGGTLEYDRLLVSPGIELNFGALPGYDEAAAEVMPHAWIPGAQTTLLAERLAAMEDGGLVVIAPPPAPFRCPPGPYERASLVASTLKANKPKSKILILDANDTFSKQKLFEEAWASLYPGMIERVPGSEAGGVTGVDAAAGTVSTDFDTYTPAVANIIPPQRAGAVARALGVASDSGWCPVDPVTFESTLVPNIHVIGDAAIAGAMPKSGFSANSQAKVAAAAVAALLAGDAPEPSKLLNTCYSIVAPGYGVSVAGVYSPGAEGIAAIEGSGGTSPLGATAETHKAEARYAESWFDTITTQMFG